MKRQAIAKLRKKPGPAPNGKGTLVGVRLQPLELARMARWPDAPEGIRRLIASR
jgi:hypothetical protein